jgi:hypothetical protein
MIGRRRRAAAATRIGGRTERKRAIRIGLRKGWITKTAKGRSDRGARDDVEHPGRDRNNKG